MRKVTENEMREWGPSGEDLEWFILALKYLHLGVFVEAEECDEKYMFLKSGPESDDCFAAYSSSELRFMFRRLIRRVQHARAWCEELEHNESVMFQSTGVTLSAPYSFVELKMKLEIMGNAANDNI